MAQVEVTNGDAVAVSVTATEEVKKSVSFTAVKTHLFVEAQKVGDAVSFYKSAFGASETGDSLQSRKRKADQELPHVVSAVLELAGSTIVVSDVASTGSESTEKRPPTMALSLETDDVTAAVEKSVAAGAVKVGDASEVEGKVTDPFGFTWIFSSPEAAKKTVTENDETKDKVKEVIPVVSN